MKRIHNGQCRMCREPAQMVHLHPFRPKQGYICVNCLEQLLTRKGIGYCSECDNMRPLPYTHPTKAEGNHICQRCFLALRRPKEPCPRCNVTRRCLNRIPGFVKRVCDVCADRVRKVHGNCSCCGKRKALRKNHPNNPDAGKVCQTCYRKLRLSLETCANCDNRRILIYAHPTEPRKGSICTMCYRELTVPEGECALCGEHKLLSYNNPKGEGRICPKCYTTSKRRAACPLCSKVKHLNRRNPADKEQKICSTCYKRLKDPIGICPQCKREEMRLTAFHPETRLRVCKTCYKKGKKALGN